MLDRRFILENTDQVKRNCANRGMTVDVDRFVALETQRKSMQAEIEELNRRANEVSKSIGKAKGPDERDARKEQGREIRERTATLREELDRLTAELDAVHKAIPNMAHPDVPVGVDDKANVELFQGKTPRRAMDFTPLDHVQLAEKHDLIDFEGGARVAGHGFYFLKNEAVLLELALQRYAVGVLVGEGFIPMTTPDLAGNDILEGIGFNPRGPETQIYSIENTDLSLVATAEITLGGLLSNQLLDAESLPLRDRKSVV
jgi:seryl-tRNA synthetase